ncbi:sulfated surface glycoprotein 185-like [Pecten maximus]|uniref:sulfated surface glycoprotein 185-like n=1 Tax=Pecten maximus TaxID=6579 RepID=UPI001458B70F|nr:sulfated surface glycoprotein 185-like [Pecten maximus]
MLVESLQAHLNVMPEPPQKKPRHPYPSRFHNSGQQTMGPPAVVQTPPSNIPTPVPPASTLTPAPSNIPTPVPPASTLTPAPSNIPTPVPPASTLTPAPSNIPTPEPPITPDHEPQAADAISSETTGMARKRLHIEHLLDNEDCIDYDSIMRVLGTCGWEEFLTLADTVLPLIDDVKTSLCVNFDMQLLFDVDRRYKDFVPSTVGNRVCLTTRADGNCLFNSFSLALYGDQAHASYLRLCSMINMKDRLVEYSKYRFSTFTCCVS